MKLRILICYLFMFGGSMEAKQAVPGTAIFAGGCFWCMEPPFEKLDGVTKVVSGYTGGRGKNPHYGDYGKKGHLEAIEVTYDPAKVSYNQLLDTFWRQIDPTDRDGSFGDRGKQYSSAIFYSTEKEHSDALASKQALDKSGRFSKPIVTEILPAKKFYPAETYHQDYAKKNPIRYKFYRWRSGRDAFLKKHWNPESNANRKIKKSMKYPKPTDTELRKKLTALQYRVTQQNGTEKAFDNDYWDNKQPGIYVDVVTGEPLFSSIDKFVSGSGWPAFSQPISGTKIVEGVDRSGGMVRTEARSEYGDSHLGHIFKSDKTDTGRHYCINSAALRFIPKADLEREGYGQYSKLFS